MTASIVTKHCSSCKKYKETQFFYKNRAKPDRLSSLCKDCTLAINAKSLSSDQTQKRLLSYRESRNPGLDRFPVHRKLLTRIFSKVTVSETSFYKSVPCWEWRGARTRNGYAVFGSAGELPSHLVHRMLYQMFVEMIHDSTMVCDHLCRIRHCVNPVHIELITNQENVLRGKRAINPSR